MIANLPLKRRIPIIASRALLPSTLIRISSTKHRILRLKVLCPRMLGAQELGRQLRDRITGVRNAEVGARGAV